MVGLRAEASLSEDDVAPALIYTILRAAMESYNDSTSGFSGLALHAEVRFILELGQQEWSSEELACAQTCWGMLQWVADARARMVAPPEQLIGSLEPNAHHVLVERSRAGDWEHVVRLVEQEGLAPWVRPTAGSFGSDGCGAICAAVAGGHGGLALYLMFKSARAIPRGPHGNMLFSSGTYRQLQAAGSCGIGAYAMGPQELYTLRALDMLRSQVGPCSEQIVIILVISKQHLNMLS